MEDVETQRLREILNALQELRGSQAPLVENYAIAVIAETEAVLCLLELGAAGDETADQNTE